MSQAINEELLAEAHASKTRGDWRSAISLFSAAIRARPDARLERDLVRLRHEAFLALDRTAPSIHRDSVLTAMPADPIVGLPVVHGPVTGAIVRDAIESHGSLIVRQFLSPDRAARLRGAVEEALAARDAVAAGGDPSAWYSEFPVCGEPHTRAFTAADGMLAVDSPRGLFHLVDTFADVEVERLASEFFGGRPAFSVEKSVFRRVYPKPFGVWHQDGAFLGEQVPSLDLWIALSPCGRRAPGLEVVSRRIDRVLPTGGFFSWDLSEEVIAREHPGFVKVTPEFEPGDAILFDQLCVHRSGHVPGMTDPRLAIECWLFAASGLPKRYTGLVL